MVNINYDIDRFGNNETVKSHQLNATVYKLKLEKSTVKQWSYAAGLRNIIMNRVRDATLIEHTLTVREAFQLYKSAISWSFLFSLEVIMTGFNISRHQCWMWTACNNADWRLFSLNLSKLSSLFSLFRKTLVQHMMTSTLYQLNDNLHSTSVCLWGR